MHDAARILLYGLLAAASLTTVLATLVVLLSGRGRANGSAFMAGFLLGEVATYLLMFFVSSAVTTIGNGHHGTVRVYVELALGIVLLVFAWRGRRQREPRNTESASGMQALFGRLEHVKPTVSFSLGAALGVGTKRLIVTAAAASTVAIAGFSRAEEVGLSALYLVVGGLTVWLPVGVYLLVGERADDWLANTKAWLTANAQRIVYLSSTAFGLIFIGDALIQLL